MHNLTPIQKSKVYQEVVNKLIEMMRNSKLEIGDKLPTEREIAALCGVSRAAVREGLSVLESAGYIEVKPRSGITIKTNPDAEFLTSINVKMDASQDAIELLEVRIGLECQAAYLAAERRTYRDIEEISKRYQALESIEDQSGYEEDFAFHYSIALATANHLLINVIDTISDRYLQYLKQRREWARNYFGLMSPSLSEHKAIMEAITEGKPKKSEQAMRAHLNNVMSRVSKWDK